MGCTVLSGSPNTPTRPPHIKFLAPFIQFRTTLEAPLQLPLHCTAHASPLQRPQTLRPTANASTATRREACPGRPARPPIATPPAIPVPSRRCHSCLKILHHSHRVSLPTCDCPALTALTPTRAATSFPFGPTFTVLPPCCSSYYNKTSSGAPLSPPPLSIHSVITPRRRFFLPPLRLCHDSPLFWYIIQFTSTIDVSATPEAHLRTTPQQNLRTTLCGDRSLHFTHI